MRMQLMGDPLVEVRNLSVTYEARRGAFIKRTEFIRAVKSVSFMVRRGTTMGLVGESGSGKSTIGKAILRLAPIEAGSIKYDGNDLTKLDEKAFMPYRKARTNNFPGSLCLHESPPFDCVDCSRAAQGSRSGNEHAGPRGSCSRVVGESRASGEFDESLPTSI